MQQAPHAGERKASEGFGAPARAAVPDEVIASQTSETSHQARRFSTFAWGVLAYNIAVILWGALVRATGSGAGCGGHWPLCNGQVLPEPLQIATRIEFTHRIMSGLALVAIVVLFAWARRVYSGAHRARIWATWSLVLIITEALLGAGLVLFGYTAKDQSTGRIISLSLHLMNTFALLASLALTAYSALAWPSRVPESHGVQKRALLSKSWPSWIALAVVVLVAVAGAITALGDTLFPVHVLAGTGGAAHESTTLSSAAAFLIRLRIIHPVLAVAAAFYLALMAFPEFLARRSPRVRQLSACLLGLVVVQLMAGGINILLRAPLVMQLLHLLIADLLWITLVLFASERRRIS